MPQISNITAKNAAGSNVIFNAMQPSSGDGVAAIWQATALSSVPSLRPRLEIAAMRSMGAKPGRRIKSGLYVPFSYTDTNTGLQLQHSVMPMFVDVTLPAGVTQIFFDDAAAYFGSIWDSSQVKSIISSGYSAT